VGRAAATLPAFVKYCTAVTSSFALRLPRAGSACWLLAVWLVAWSGPAAAQGSDSAWTRPAMPKPAAVRDALPAVFRKPAPVSLADLRAIQRHVTALVPRVSAAVVAVEIGDGSGSGVVVSPDGLVLTAGHVADRAGRKAVLRFPDGKTTLATTIGVDADADTGVMRILEPGPWPYVSIGEDDGRLGDWTLALGNPGGFDPARSLVVRLGRIIRVMPGLMQTDCAILPGDSGGPLFDMHGRVIGIHTAIARSTEENFHVSITEFFDTWAGMIGPAARTPAQPLAYAGISVVDDAAGCRLIQIEKDGPASKAGLKVGDRLLKVEGRQIIASASFQRWVAESRPGETLHLEIKRGGKLLSVPIQLQPPPRNR
jgi:serine protease Do